jgi:amino-acid N-acetyltransferase
MLAASQLPEDDLDDPKVFLSCISEDSRPIAAIGVERYSRNGLLRSLVVSPEKRGEGLARLAVLDMEEDARKHGLSALFLLTGTADGFFERLGYSRVARLDVPEEIRSTTQYSSLCSENATVMRKQIRS